MSSYTRRDAIRRVALTLGPAALWRARIARAGHQPATPPLEPFSADVLPAGIRSRFVDRLNGLRMHVLEAGDPSRPCVLLLHGFPELAFSWRKILGPLADAGFHVLAPDLRGYGRTTGWDDRYDTDLAPFGLLNYVRDALALVSAFGHRSVSTVVGHDFGSVIAPWCPLVRPDVFRAVVMMSAPFAGAPSLPFDTVRAQRDGSGAPKPQETLDEGLAKLSPPRKQYRVYYSTRAANDDMMRAPQGLHAFLRAYYHMKSADWRPNVPFRLTATTAAEFAKLPAYYVMDLRKTMPETVADALPTKQEIAACRWLTEDELRVYAAEYGRTGFQGGLDGYRVRLTDRHNVELQLFSGRSVDVPSMFIGGKADWGVHQTPGAFESMQKTVCTRMEAVHLIDGAGHWVQQEQPDAVIRALLPFVRQQVPR